jgi:hypothetical protein
MVSASMVLLSMLSERFGLALAVSLPVVGVAASPAEASGFTSFRDRLVVVSDTANVVRLNGVAASPTAKIIAIASERSLWRMGFAMFMV